MIDPDFCYQRFGENKSCECRTENGGYQYKCNFCKYACCKDCIVKTCVCRCSLEACDACKVEKKSPTFGYPHLFHPYLCVGSHS